MLPAIRAIRTITGLVLAITGLGFAAEVPEPRQADHSASRYKIIDGRLRFEGSNAVHDWLATGSEVSGFLEVGPDFPAQLGLALTRKEVKARSEVSIPVRSLRSIEKDGSPYSRKFDEVMYERLDSATYPAISFQLASLSWTGVQEGQYVFNSTGELTVRGATNIVHIPVKVLPLPGDRLMMSGVADLKQKDFKIPCGFVCFTVPRDEVRVIFDLTLQRQSSHGPD